jgi:uncharacterized protein (DUF58 family)
MGRINRIYILPTGFGFVFIAGALVMILVGASYQNNLVNMLAFFMMSLIFIAMVQTHNNLKDIALEQMIAEGAFAETEFLVTIILKNTSDQPRFNLETRLRRLKPRAVYENVHPLLPRSNLKLRATYPAVKRGLYHLKDVHVSAVFPLGLFRAWILFSGETQVYVYPKPAGHLDLSRAQVTDLDVGTLAVRGGDDFYGHRRYQPGDSVGHIDWRARAKGRPLLVKEFNQGSPSPRLIDWFQLEGLETEARLSQLTAWINAAVLSQDVFGLRLPGQLISPAQGPAHVQRCLEALAVFDERFAQKERPNAS